MTRRAASQLSPHGLTAQLLTDRLAIDVEPSHRSANSAQTNNHSLVSGEFEATNSVSNGLGAICGYCAVACAGFEASSGGRHDGTLIGNILLLQATVDSALAAKDLISYFAVHSKHPPWGLRVVVVNSKYDRQRAVFRGFSDSWSALVRWFED